MLDKSKAKTARSILRIIEECEADIRRIEMISLDNLCICSSGDNYTKTKVMPDVRAQIIEIAIDACRRKIEELEKQLADL